MSPSLSIVPVAPVPAKVETVAQHVQRLQAEARQLASEHVKALSAAMVSLQELAAEIADGGEAYVPGVRDVCRRLADDLDSRVQTLEAIEGRARR
jgi:ABC-type transporter Mla subunit MlaD